ncbi:hypothetical protein B0H14DRAFT_849832 [Mycena olivaceomarginata]|nr:hypothetical protein B0H14DRAFT_849832 [Mycena olivaceomarginata]
MDPRKRGFVPGAQASFAVVIDGDTLSHTLSPPLKEMFLNLGTQCETVVCCRVSPAQKALTLKLVKEGRNAMTLSIGDGANDVAMIQEANLGCGLFGLEGSQEPCKPEWVVLLRVRAPPTLTATFSEIQTPKRGDHPHTAGSPVEHRNDPQRAHGAGERHQPPIADVWDAGHVARHAWADAVAARGAAALRDERHVVAGCAFRVRRAAQLGWAWWALEPGELREPRQLRHGAGRVVWGARGPHRRRDGSEPRAAAVLRTGLPTGRARCAWVRPRRARPRPEPASEPGERDVVGRPAGDVRCLSVGVRSYPFLTFILVRYLISFVSIPRRSLFSVAFGVERVLCMDGSISYLFPCTSLKNQYLYLLFFVLQLIKRISTGPSSL